MSAQKIAILGGGVGAMTTAWALTSLPNARDRFDITVYQMGWRLGGKGASGRNADFGQRIEEHGLHIWMGFYDNAFKAMQECYAELDRPASCPIRTWTDAFFPHQDICLYEFVAGHWHGWQIKVPLLPGVPGTPRDDVKIRELFTHLVRWMRDLMLHPFHEPALVKIIEEWASSGKPGWVKSEVLAAENWVLGKIHPQSPLGHGDGPSHLAWLVDDLHAAIDKVEDLTRDGIEFFESLLADLDKFLDRLRSLVRDFIEAHPDIRRIWVLMDLAVAVARGLIRDGVLWNGFRAMAGLDFRDWLRKHGASEEARASATVRTMYDLCFGYRLGELDDPNMDAAVLLRTLLLIGFTYRGGFMYRMSAGMGDVVFGPYYEALKKRGVKFEFFHKVRNLGLSGDKTAIDTITVDRQVGLAPGRSEYDPFVMVKGLPCWPSTPNFDQIENGAALKRSGQNLESFQCDWPIKDQRVLKRGTDFDQVVLGISLGGIPEICGELIGASQKWNELCANVLTVETQGVQIWLRKTFEELGWTDPPSVGATYAEPLDTWAQMTDLLRFEDWPADKQPKAVLYLCGPLRHMVPGPQKDFVTLVRHQQVLSVARTWLQSHLAVCLPKCSGLHNPSGLDVNLLHAPTTPIDPILDQYLRANIDPTEKYVLSIAGTSPYRLRGSESDFTNLALAGDWVWTPINAGCVEAATMGGLDAARKISGDKIPVFGWNSIDTPGPGDQN